MKIKITLWETFWIKLERFMKYNHYWIRYFMMGENLCWRLKYLQNTQIHGIFTLRKSKNSVWQYCSERIIKTAHYLNFKTGTTRLEYSFNYSSVTSKTVKRHWSIFSFLPFITFYLTFFIRVMQRFFHCI